MFRGSYVSGEAHVYAVNARFDRPDDSDADVVRLEPR